MAPVPPSVAHAPWLWAFSVFGLLSGTLIAAQWLAAPVLRMIEEPRPLRDPETMHRIMMAGLMIATILRIGPDALNVMVWPDVTPATRYWLSDVNRLLDGLSIVPFVVASMAANYSRDVWRSQLTREPIPIELWTSWPQVRLSASIAIVLLAISLGVTVLR